MELAKNFNEIVSLIEGVRSKALKKVNEELIKLYWNVVQSISEKVASSEWGNSVIDEVAEVTEIEK